MAKRPAAKKRRGKGGTPRRGTVRRFLARVTVLLVLLGLGACGAWVLWLDHRVTSAFEGKRWSVPARVHARPLELHEGLSLSPAELEVELAAADYGAASPPDAPGTYERRGNRFRIHTRGFRFWDGSEPRRRVAVTFGGGRVTSVSEASSGSALPLLRLEPATIGTISPGHSEDRILVRLGDVPRSLVAALLAIEDHRFLEHHGVSPTGVLRALIANIRAGDVVQGGSTLTQQLVKNYFLTRERTLWRKVNEAVMAVILELRHDKPEILEAYLNEIYLGQDGERSIHGFGLAAWHYFGRDLADLELSQQATLVALARGPSYYDPVRHPERARERRNRVLGLMREHGLASDAAVSRARGQPLDVRRRPPGERVSHPAFMDLVKRHLRRDYRNEDLTTDGLRVFTTLAPHVQEAAEAALAERAAGWDAAVEGALVSVRVESGEVEAVVGGRDAGFAGFNRALDARRPVGSLIKPATYLAALSRPDRFGLGTLLRDAPVTLQDARGEAWSPRNHDREWHGDVPLWLALARSYNVPAVRLGLDVGLRGVVDVLSRLGGPVPDNVYPSLLLGAVEAAPVEMAQMYQTLAAGGYRSPLRSVQAVVTRDGELLSHYPLSVDRVVDPEPVYLLNRALQSVVTEGTAQALSRWLPEGIHAAGKTGTTDELRDSWFAGFTGDRLAVVWVGRDDNAPSGLTGASGAMTVWGELFARLSPEPLRLNPPEGVETIWIERATGRLAAASCPGAVPLPYVRGRGPDRRSPCVEEPGIVDRASGWMRSWLE